MPSQSLDLVGEPQFNLALEENGAPSFPCRARQSLSTPLRTVLGPAPAAPLPFWERGSGPETLRVSSRFSFLRLSQSQLYLTIYPQR